MSVQKKVKKDVVVSREESWPSLFLANAFKHWLHVALLSQCPNKHVCIRKAGYTLGDHFLYQVSQPVGGVKLQSLWRMASRASTNEWFSTRVLVRVLEYPLIPEVL